MANLFYATGQLSENMFETPEGYLLCTDVSIGRTGTMQYLGKEIGLEDRPNDVIDVYRDEEDVFDEKTIASFEGKSVTDNHPPVDVDPSNYKAYEMGHMQNVHRGDGNESDKLIADLLIKDASLIQKVRDGKREVSCGYSCQYFYDDETNKVYQRNIRGNHVAVVDRGRAGREVKIKDEALDNKPIERSVTKLGEKKKGLPLFLSLLMGSAKDKQPEEINALADDASDFISSTLAKDCDIVVEDEEKAITKEKEVIDESKEVKEEMVEKTETNDREVAITLEKSVIDSLISSMDKLSSKIESMDASWAKDAESNKEQNQEKEAVNISEKLNGILKNVSAEDSAVIVEEKKMGDAERDALARELVYDFTSSISPELATLPQSARDSAVQKLTGIVKKYASAQSDEQYANVVTAQAENARDSALHLTDEARINMEAQNAYVLAAQEADERARKARGEK